MRAMMVLAAALVAAGCQKAETAEQAAARMQAEADSAKAAIEAQNQAFMRYMTANAPDSLASLYTEDATVMAPNMATVTGRANIREAFAGMLAAGVPQFHLTTQTVSANGPLAVERGRYHLELAAAAGRPAIADSGKYLVEWRLVDGRWLLHNDIWNSDAPMEQPAPARRR